MNINYRAIGGLMIWGPIFLFAIVMILASLVQMAREREWGALIASLMATCWLGVASYLMIWG